MGQPPFRFGGKAEILITCYYNAAFRMKEFYD